MFRQCNRIIKYHKLFGAAIIIHVLDYIEYLSLLLIKLYIDIFVAFYLFKYSKSQRDIQSLSPISFDCYLGNNADCHLSVTSYISVLSIK